MTLRDTRRVDLDPIGSGALPRAMAATLALALLTLSSCRIHRIQVDHLEKEPQTITSLVKAHLVDGSVIVFPDGVVIVGTEVTARVAGTRYDIRLENAETVSTVPLDSVAAMESFSTPIEATATGVFGGGAFFVGGLVAIFIVIVLIG